MNNNNKVLIPVVLLVCSGCLLACIAVVCVTSTGLLVSRFANYNKPVEWQSVEEGDEAPDFKLEALSGDLVRLSDLRGGPVVLSFGASWCPPCREEVTILQKLHETYPDLVVMLVDVNEGFWTVQDFADEFDLTFTVVLDEDSAVAIEYGVEAIPKLYFIDEAGQVQVVSVGTPSKAELAKYLELIGIESDGW